MDHIIETVEVTKTYMSGGRPLEVLKGINLKVEPGEFMAIMGPSGSGKSTLLNMIGALDRPTSGKVYINGTDLSHLNDNQIADVRNTEIGFIFQFFNLIPRMDAQRNIELPMAIKGISRGQRKKRALNLLELVGLGDRADHKPSQLSGGEQQRVAIARSLANEPNILLADELTGNLDSKTGEEIMILLRQLNEEEGKTFILITHDPQVAQNTDRLVSFKDGIIEGEKNFKDMI
ncbi:ABC transporter ATP-binding protein [Candidatus Bathyarchaeota archaeon]|jgi:putative ABC transport system ATP-binding protein|nr:ABC transporter ATP-binding protein [Candidatus Bathyarchaeota archaeon]MBT6603730.1 ABC transporter ATP-binding protein [Candidatus Bathyarchaeota archaeon]MBT7185747.1 ABC transporter ATP-binding protein [Candidatus Bathyarchaeota archaeon]